MRTRDTDIVIVPGLGGSGPDHWQSRWQAKLPNARRVEQADWDRPDLTAWLDCLAETVAGCERPVVLVAHSLGAIAVAQGARRGDLVGLAGAFLVVPPSDAAMAALPEIDPAFRPTPRQAFAFPALVVASRNDPCASLSETESLASNWGARLLDAGQAAHINVDSGHGPWPEGLMAFGGFLNQL